VLDPLRPPIPPVVPNAVEKLYTLFHGDLRGRRGHIPPPSIELFVALKWVPQSPKQAVPILALQVGAELAAMAPVFLLQW